MDTPRWSPQSTLRVAVLLVAAFLFGVAFEQGTFHRWFNATSAHQRAVRKYDLALQYIQKYHVDDHDPEMLTRQALRAITKQSLDRHSSYLDPDTYETFSRSTQGKYVGLGIRVSKHEEKGVIEVVHPFRGSPAMDHDIRPGDLIVAVEGTSTKDLSLEEAVAKIKGPEGTDVTITVRSGENERTITLKRTEVDIPTVAQWGILEEGGPPIGYVAVRQFSKNTDEAFQEALHSLMNRDVRGLIVDLRFNPGGLLDASVDLADLFLPAGKDVVTVRQRGRTEEVHRSTSDPTWANKPVAILLNEHSASASEVFAGALRDHGVATLVGTRTFGKGSVQRPIEFPGEKDALKLTVARYYTPSGKTFDRSGSGNDSGGKPETNDGSSGTGSNESDRSYGLVPDHKVRIAETEEQRKKAHEKLIDSWQEAASTSAGKQFTLDIYRDPQLEKALDVLRKQLSETN